MSFLSNIELVQEGNPAVDVGATGPWDANNKVVKNMATPVLPTDGAPKGYVDTEIAANAPSWTQVLEAKSLVDQMPVSLDTLLQIEFGVAQGGGGDPVEISALGAITFNQTAFYQIVLGATIGRSAATGSAFLIFRALINGSQVALGGTTELSDNDNKRPTSLSLLSGNFIATQILTIEMHRSSQGGSGQNDGGLFAVPNTGALAWGTSPSASIMINKFNPT